MPLDKHEEVKIFLKGCGAAGEHGVVFQLNGLPLDQKVEFRGGLVSADLPVKVNMELMTQEAYKHSHHSILDSVKDLVTGRIEKHAGTQLFEDVEKIVFVPPEPSMYVRVTAIYDGELRPDIEEEACKALLATFVLEKLFFGFIPVTMAVLLSTCVIIVILFWVVGMPLLTWALGPQLVEEARKAEEEEDAQEVPGETKKNK